MKFGFSLLFLFSSAVGSSQQLAFDTLNYDQVKAYEFNGSGARKITHCLERETARINRDTVLTKELIKEFEKTITASGSYGQTTAACFDPHLAIVYYLDDQIVAVIDVCLECNYLISTLDIPARSEFKIDSGTEYERPLSGFSKETRQKIDEFLSKIEFSKYRKPLDSVFDE